MDESKLIKYILEETDQAENQEIKQWIAAHPNHKKKYERVQYVWEKSQFVRPSKVISTEQAWQDFLKRRDHRSPQTTKHVSLYPWYQVAAAAVVFLIATAFVYVRFLEPDNALLSNIHLASEQKTVSDTLFDGSVITLNKSSQLAFNQSIFNKERKAKLVNGEAFFQVEKNENRPFQVQAGEVKITVLGTKFNVKKHGEQVEVILQSGAVRVNYEDKERVLKPGDKLLINQVKGLLTSSTAEDELYSYYVGDYFEANDTPLWRVIEVLNEAYGANIILLNERLRNLPLTTTFKNDSLENNLEVLKATFGLTVIRKPHRIIIK
ncbi:Fe2+-dicitrate sensor protein [Echinicola strongylocentroti]|uniref:Fe2+-dicitrate sensor protein n=1 Tax=Echinicola strongylocentroti TaxID=1795355 RepID=A0A2Z4IMJ7_9BACT|nr:FecR domain-containing protein [Echinicola strongylocentroti]AWW32125.1 Fe2+-dicitrate sensor protein [Echinicola strongylocentroti]